jgi:hypothetical protein
MSEQAPRVEQTPQQIQQDETAAYAMKPEMDIIARERSIAPRTGALAMREGGVTMIEVPYLDTIKSKEHAIRSEYANRDAKAALKAEEVIQDPGANASEIVRADQQLKNLIDPYRQPRPIAQIRKSAERIVKISS